MQSRPTLFVTHISRRIWLPFLALGGFTRIVYVCRLVPRALARNRLIHKKLRPLDHACGGATDGNVLGHLKRVARAYSTLHLADAVRLSRRVVELDPLWDHWQTDHGSVRKRRRFGCR